MTNPRSIDQEIDALGREIRNLIERLRQASYDSGYSDALAVLAERGTPEQLAQQRAV